MAQLISQRLQEIIDALPLHENIRIVEIGCGTGIVAREIASRFERIYILGIDRSEKAIKQAVKNCYAAIAAGKASFLPAAIEKVRFDSAGGLFDLAFAIRVGALDGRHPDIELAALKNIARILQPGSKLYIDGGLPLKEIDIDPYRKI